MLQPAARQNTNVLSYADLPARYGIQYEVRPDGVSFLMPPPPWWKRPELVAAAVLIPLFTMQYIAAAARSSPVAGIWIASGVIVFTSIVTAALSRVRRATRIELTGDALVLENVLPFLWTEMAMAPVMRYRRQDVYDVQFVTHSGNIVIRVRGSEMIEFSPVPDTRVKEWMAEELRRALGLPA